MKTTILITILIFILVGCATQGNVPAMPKYETQSERACARKCQDTFAQCNLPCTQYQDGFLFPKKGKRCLDNCNQVLRDCYSSCEQAPEVMEKKGI